MPSFNLTTVDSVFRSLGNGDTGYISATGGMINAGITSYSSTALLNYGFVNLTGTAVHMLGLNNYVENHGDLVGGGVYATVLNYDFFGDPTGSLHLVNTGRIGTRGTSTTDAIYIYGNDNDISNSGTIESRLGTAIVVYHNGAQPGSRGVSITNSGHILGQAEAAIQLVGTKTNTILNSGWIVGAILTGDGHDSITNHGTIQGSVSTGAGAGSLANHGMIDGSVEMVGGGAYIVNTGTITGNLQLGYQNDTVNLRGGTLGGYVADFGGNDTYHIDDSTVHIVDSGGLDDRVFAWADFELGLGLEDLLLRGTATTGLGNGLDNYIHANGLANHLEGGAGNDSILGLGGDDLILADEGHDSVLGGSGADTLIGDAGNDTLLAEAGADVLDGGEGRDTLEGGGGHDLLFGGSENDRLLGGDGDDTLDGGGGSDYLSGGLTGRDLFIFRHLSDSGTTTATRDRIYNFVSGQDRIDLSALDADTTSMANDIFVVVGGFSASAGELVITDLGADIQIDADVTGDGFADFSIRLVNLASLSVNDLVL